MGPDCAIFPCTDNVLRTGTAPVSTPSFDELDYSWFHFLLRRL